MFDAGNLITLGVVLVVLIAFRILDKDNRSLEKIKKYTDKLKEELDAVAAERAEALKSYAVEVDSHKKAAKEVLRQVQEAETNLAARAEGIHTAVETCGFCDWNLLDRLRTRCDLFLFDLKADPASHESLTGVPFERIGQNLRRLHDAGSPLWIRLPVVPGVNDTPARFQHAAEIIRSLPRIQAVDVLAYHAMGTEKISRMGLDTPPLNGIPTPSSEQVQGWIQQLAERGVSARTPGSA